MARKQKKAENETQTLYNLECGDKHRIMRKKVMHTVGPGNGKKH